MNVFPGTGAAQKMNALRGTLAEIRALPGQPAPFPVGLWLDNGAAMELQGPKGDSWIAETLDMGYCAYTANAFPFGTFHGASVKTDVYHPDWTTPERVKYTIAVANVLARLCPPGRNASISTLPGGYKTHMAETDLPCIAANLLKTAEAFAHIQEETGIRVRLAVEMEPDCLWEAPAEFTAFYDKFLRHSPYAEHIGVCYDTCHQELLAGNPGDGLRHLEKRQVPIVKIQLSAAISTAAQSAWDALAASFQDKVYLHQTRVLENGAVAAKWADLPEALASGDRRMWRCHFHVPVFLDKIPGGLAAAKGELLETIRILKLNPAICDTLEIETYSYNVLPDFLKEKSLADCLAKEAAYIDSLFEMQ